MLKYIKLKEKKEKGQKERKEKALLEKENNYSTCSKHLPTLLGCASLAISENKYINIFLSTLTFIAL